MRLRDSGKYFVIEVLATRSRSPVFSPSGSREQSQSRASLLNNFNWSANAHRLNQVMKVIGDCAMFISRTASGQPIL